MVTKCSIIDSRVLVVLVLWYPCVTHTLVYYHGYVLGVKCKEKTINLLLAGSCPGFLYLLCLLVTVHNEYIYHYGDE